jgi:hypothetical protein
MFWAKGYNVQPGSEGNLIYHGGPVVANIMRVYAIFWEPDRTFVGPGYNSLLMRYFSDIGDSSLYANNIQYTDSTRNAPDGAMFAGSWVDRSPYPSTPGILDADVQNEVTHAMVVNGWLPAINHAFFVFTSLNEFICATSDPSTCSAPLGNFCAYHSAFGDINAPTIYGAMPYIGNALTDCYSLNKSPNGDAASDAEMNATSHEQIEIATDPIPGFGWLDRDGQEIGDKCAFIFGPLMKNGANVIFNGHPYILQTEWDNARSRCVLQGP